MSDLNEVVALKNGSKAPLAAVEMITLVLRRMISGDLDQMQALIDFVDCVRDDKPLSEKSQKIILSYGLIEAQGVVHDNTRNILLSAAVGEGLMLQLVSPYA